MKRALAVLLACCGFAAFAQFPAFKGSWTAEVCVIPSISLTSTLSLTTNIAGFDITGAFRFTGGGLDRASFTYKGAAGPLSLSGAMYFAPTVPEYMGASLSTSLDFAGLGIGFDVYHWDTDYNSCFFYPATCWPYLKWYDTATSPCTQTGIYGMLYKLTMKIDPISAKLYFVDCCQGIEFDKAVLTLKGIGLCCGISLDAEMAFIKEGGFQYITFSGINIPLCCGVSIDITVKFTPTAKEVTPKFKFGGIGDACFTVYGDALGTPPAWEGLTIYGWKIKCTIADCNYVEFLTALNVDKIEEILGDIFLAACGEYEYMKLGFCGPGCCGGKYTVDLSLYFGSNGGLFDLTRLVYSVKIPIMTNFTLSLSGTAAAATCASNKFCFGWTFTF